MNTFAPVILLLACLAITCGVPLVRILIEAIQATGTPESNREIIDWTRCSDTPASMDRNADDAQQLSISTLEGAHWVSLGDWVIKGVKGEFYPCKPDIFAATYEPVNEAIEA